MNRILFLGGIAAALTLVGCGNSGGASNYKPKPPSKIESAEVQPGQEATLLPLAVGTQWVYTTAVRVTQKDGQSGSTTGELTFRVTAVRDVPGGKEGDIDIINNEGKLAEKQSWRVDASGITQTAGGDKGQKFDPPLASVLFPVKLEETFSWKGIGPFPGGMAKTATSKSKVLGYEELDTDMGRMQGLAVESRMSWTAADGKKGQSYGTTWWRPNYGFVRFRQEIQIGDLTAVQMFRLKSYTPGK